jgi:hypothetical protein
MDNNETTPRTKLRLGALELIVILATIIPCCLATFAFFGVERIQDLLGSGQATPAPTQIHGVGERGLPTETVTAAPTPMATVAGGAAGFDVTGVWVGQFHDAGYAETTDYLLEMQQSGRNLTGTALVSAPANSNCNGEYVIRGQVDPNAQTVRFSEDSGQFRCTFRGSAGDKKEFELSYSAADGLPALTGVWHELFHGMLPPSGKITFYRQP